MSSIKQELAAILMDYTDVIPDQKYIEILERLGQIPDHKDPKKAIEIQQELDKENLGLKFSMILNLNWRNAKKTQFLTRYLKSKKWNLLKQKTLNI